MVLRLILFAKYLRKLHKTHRASMLTQDARQVVCRQPYGGRIVVRMHGNYIACKGSVQKQLHAKGSII